MWREATALETYSDNNRSTTGQMCVCKKLHVGHQVSLCSNPLWLSRRLRVQNPTSFPKATSLFCFPGSFSCLQISLYVLPYTRFLVFYIYIKFYHFPSPNKHAKWPGSRSRPLLFVEMVKETLEWMQMVTDKFLVSAWAAAAIVCKKSTPSTFSGRGS